MKKKSLNEAIMEEAGIPNLKNTFEDSRTHVDMPYGLGSAYIESEKRRKEIEDRFKEKDKEIEEYKKMYASEESKTRIKPEVNKKMYLSESLFEDTIKTKSGKWVNKGDTGETHGEFKTKKDADAQRKAIFAGGWKKESLKEASEDAVVFTQTPAGQEEDWFDMYYGDDYIFDKDSEGIVIYGNRRFKSFGDDTLLEIVKGNYEGDENWNEEEGYYENYDVIEMLKKVTGKDYKRRAIYGYSQGDWQNIYFPSENSDLIKDIETYYFGKYDEWYSEDEGSLAIPHDITWKGNEAIKKYISDELGVPVDKIKLRKFKGYRQVADYDEDENESLTEARAGKTKEIIVLQGNYGYGWDDLVEYEVSDYREARADKKDYDENERQYDHRLIRRRVPNPDYKEKEITEAKVRPEDDVDFDEFDMFAFISNLFVKDMKPDLLPLKSIGGFDSQGKELTATEDSIILGTNNEEDFDEVKEICDEYDFGHRDTKVPNGKSKFYHEIDVPTYENGYPMDIAEYFEEVEIPLKEVMPEKYIRKLEASRKATASAFDKKKK